MQRKDNQKIIQSVARALDMLRYIGNEGKPVTLTELSRGLDLSISTVHGILNTLKRYDFVSQDPENDKYFLGFSLLQLGNKVPDGIDLHRITMPHITELSELYGDTVHLAIRSQYEAVYVAKVEGKRAYRLTSRVGERRPLHCCSIGKSMLAFLRAQDLDELLERMPLVRLTPNTITDRTALRRHLEEVRAQGYALDWEETEIGLCGAGAPILNHEGVAVAAISIAMPTNRFYEHGGESIGRNARETVRRISERLGHAPLKK